MTKVIALNGRKAQEFKENRERIRKEQNEDITRRLREGTYREGTRDSWGGKRGPVNRSDNMPRKGPGNGAKCPSCGSRHTEHQGLGLRLCQCGHKFTKAIKKATAVCGFRYAKTKNTYSAKNNTFDAETLEAYSYGWWRYVERIGDLVVFNDYSYSPSTTKHQSHMRHLLRHLGIEVDVTIEAPQGLQNLTAAVEHYERQINVLRDAIAAPRSRKAKNAWREKRIREFKHTLKQVQKLQEIRERIEQAS